MQLSTSARCKNHPNAIALWRCEACDAFMCKLCVSLAAGKQVCDRCGKPCVAVASAPPAQVQPPVLKQPAVQAPQPAARQAVQPPAIAPKPTGVPVPRTAPVLPASIPIPSSLQLQPSNALPSSAPALKPPAAQAQTPPVQEEALPSADGDVSGEAQEDPLGEAIRCGTHPGSAATRRCEECMKFHCGDCIKEGKRGLVCACGGKLRKLNAEELGKKTKDFFAEIPKAIVYPFSGNGKWALLFGGALYWGTSTFASSFFAFAGLCAFVMNIIRCSANGEDKAPGFPDMTDAFNTLFLPALRIIGAVLVSFAPMLLFCYFVIPIMIDNAGGAPIDDPPIPTYLQRGGSGEGGVWMSGEEHNPIFADPNNPILKQRHKDNDEMLAKYQAQLQAKIDKREALRAGAAVKGLLYAIALFCAGAFYLPMAILGVSIFETIGPLNPLFVIPSILRILPHYAVAYGVLLGVGAVGFFADSMGGIKTFQQIMTGLIGGYMTLYFCAVEGRLLGILYDSNQDRLKWFE